MTTVTEAARASLRDERPNLLRGLGTIAILGCAVFSATILVADVVVPDHDWMADTISDLGAGPYEMIVDVGIYAYAAALIACAVGAAHAHLDGTRWSAAIYALILLGLIVFLVGARNEYGDAATGGPVIHVYLVYALGALFAFVPWAMSAGVAKVSPRLGRVCRLVSFVWIPLAPAFFFMPDGYDGLYERMLGVVTFAFVVTMGIAFYRIAEAVDPMGEGGGRAVPSAASRP